MRTILAFGVAAVCSLGALGSLSARADDELAALEARAGEFQGALSCAATACHGSPRGSALLASARGDEYTLWSQHDPHARAATTLSSPRSREMLRRLGLASASDGGAVACVGCHNPAAVEPPTRELAATVEGVSCEACHGPAEHWLATHYQRGARGLEQRPRPLDTALARARLCVECHVGAADREVNHDLIAAGHPPLRFELASYLHRLPKHWDDRRRRPAATRDNSAPAEAERRTWLAGQLAAAEASLAVLEARAARSVAGAPGAVWPELAEFNCFSCHRSLSAGAAGSPGHAAWGDWFVAPAASLAAESEHAAARQFAATVTDIRQLLQQPTPPADAVAPLAGDARRRLAEWIADAAESSGRLHDAELAAASAALLRIATAPAEEGREPLAARPESWEALAQGYLALAAWSVDDGRRGGLPAADPQAPATAALLELRRALQFPRGAAGPAGDFRSPSPAHDLLDRAGRALLSAGGRP